MHGMFVKYALRRGVVVIVSANGTEVRGFKSFWDFAHCNAVHCTIYNSHFVYVFE
jgi:hypothetical protein